MFSNSSIYKEDLKYVASINLDWAALEDKTILITGANGLIGTVLIDAILFRNKEFESNIKIIALSRNQNKLKQRFIDYIDNNNFSYISADTASTLPSFENIDYIVHLASNTHPALYSSDPINTIMGIVDGTKNILDLASKHNVRCFLNASSVEVYGENRGDVERFTEEYCGYINCNTLRAGYSEGKRLSESLCQAYIKEKNTNVINARFGRVYGAPMLPTDTKSTSQFIHSAVMDQDIILKSKGLQEYSYVYVADAATAILTLLTKGLNGNSYNISNDEIISIKETAYIISSFSNNKVITVLPDEEEKSGHSIVQKAIMDSSKLKKLGWESKYNLRNGLGRTLDILKGMKND